MNLFNILFCYLIADSKVKHYNVLEPQKVKNIALMIGSFSQNLAINYLMIDSQAKNLQQNSTTIAEISNKEKEEASSINTETKEIETILEETKSEINNLITNSLSQTINKKFSNHLFKSENPETIKLLSDFKNDLNYFNTLSEKKEIEKTKKNIEELLNNKNIKLLDKNDGQTIVKLKKMMAKNGYFNKMESLIENQKEYPSIQFDLLFSNSAISRVIYDIEEKLHKIESDKLIATSKE